MISGEFKTCPAEQIIINREERQRRVLNNIPRLAKSISKRGLIQPPVITREYVLVAGERRIAAMKSLGWDTIPFQFLDEAPVKELKKLELEENLQREDLEWQDRIDAIKTIHELELADDPTWTHDDTAEELGLDRGYVSELMRVAKAMSINPIVAQQPNLSSARRIVKAQEQRRAAYEEESLEYGSGVLPPNQPVLHARFEDWASTYDGPRFNLIHCDFPYGIGFDRMGAQAGLDYGRYKDTIEIYNSLLGNLTTHLDKFAEESCHILFWFSIQNYEYTYNTLTNAGFVIDQFPFIWLKSDNTGIIPDAARGPRRIYETAFFGRRGDRMILRPKSNAIAWPSTGKIHPHEKPAEMLQYFFEMLVDEHTALFDPTCGSGAALRAAKKLGAARILGLEIDEHYVRMANAELEKDA